eukprot:3614303-Rhodomonas_salina.1
MVLDMGRARRVRMRRKYQKRGRRTTRWVRLGAGREAGLTWGVQAGQNWEEDVTMMDCALEYHIGFVRLLEVRARRRVFACWDAGWRGVLLLGVDWRLERSTLAHLLRSSSSHSALGLGLRA